MIQEEVRRWATRLGVIAAGSAVLVGCPERADEVTEPASEASVDFPVASAYQEPEGSFAVDRLTLAAFDTTVTDAFGQGTGVLGSFNDGNAFGLLAYTLEGLARNSSNDPRLPALADDDAEVGGFCVLGSPPFAGIDEGFWDLFCQVVNLEPNTTYTVMMVRYALTVNAELDANARALGEPVTQPDELSLIGGTPGGFPLVPCDFTVGVPVSPDLNPFVLGFVDTDASGVAVIDCVPVSTQSNPTWWRNFEEFLPDGVEDSIPFAANAGGGGGVDLSIPSYNYLVLVEGQGTGMDPVPAGPHVMRWQVGHDIDMTGTASMNNALAPFPTPFTVPQLVDAPGGAGRPDSISMVFNGLEAIAGGSQYSAWLVNPGTGDRLAATGTYDRIKIIAERDPITGEIVSTRDSVVETVNGANAFAGGNQEDGFRHALTLSDQLLAGGAEDSVGFYTHLMLTIDNSPGDENPGQAMPFWFQFTDQAGTPENFFDDAFFTSGNTSFGNFDPAEPSSSRIYNGAGVGVGGFRANVLSVDLQNMSRPPVGYELVGWLVPEEGDPVRLPDITGPPPARIDLTEADVDAYSNLVTSTGILQANFSALESEVAGSFADYVQFHVRLEPKAGVAAMSPTPVYLGAVPELLRTRE